MLRRPRLGKRGTALVVFATLDVIYGARISVVPGDSRSVYTWLESGWVPLWGWTSIWVGVGLLCACYAMRVDDRPAFSAAIIIKVAWGMLNVIGWATGEVADGWILATIWLAFAVCVGLLSSLPEASEAGGRKWTPPSR